MTSEAVFKVGSANILQIPSQVSPSSYRFGEKDPMAVRDRLGVNQLADALFPVVVTGVRYWPFLLLARDHGSNKTTWARTAKAVREAMQRILETERNLGPGSPASFGPYRNMYKRIEEKGGFRFLEDGRTSLTATNVFRQFDKEIEWKRGLKKSCGPGGKQFLELLQKGKKARGKNKSVDEVEYSIEQVVTGKKGFDPDLEQAVFSYLVMRILYGFKSVEGNTVAAVREELAKKLLERLVTERWDKFAPYKEAIEQYVKDKNDPPSPPWGYIHEKLSAENKRVLSGFRFYTVRNLYVRTCPPGYSPKKRK